MLSDQFSQVFRDEHRQIRDTLLDLIVAFQERDKARIQKLLQQTATCTGPHFRYEEEALYPSLVEFFGEDYIEKLLQAHDQAIGTAGKLVELAGKEQLNNEDVTEATRLIRGVLPHVSDCEGLSIMVERLPEEKVSAILAARDHADQAGLDLIQWAEQVRTRPSVAPT
jgi:hypothetical protein